MGIPQGNTNDFKKYCKNEDCGYTDLKYRLKKPEDFKNSSEDDLFNFYSLRYVLEADKKVTMREDRENIRQEILDIIKYNKQRLCHELSLNRDSLKSSAKYLQTVMLILFLEKDLLKNKNKIEENISEIVLANYEYFEKIIQLSEIKKAKQKITEMYNKYINPINNVKEKIPFFLFFSQIKDEIKSKNFIYSLNCYEKVLKEDMIDSIRGKIKELLKGNDDIKIKEYIEN